MNFKTAIYLFFFSFFSIASFAQSVYENDVSMSQGIKNALSIEIENADRKTAENIWKNFIKEYGKTKKDNRSGEWRAQQVIVPYIDASSPVDLYIRLEEMGGMTRAYLWVDMGFDYVNSIDHENESDGAEVFLKNYYREVRKEVVKSEIEDQEDILRDLEKELEKLKDKNKDLYKDIEEYREKISKAELEIEGNIQDQAQKVTEIETQRLRLQSVIEKLNQIGRTQ